MYKKAMTNGSTRTFQAIRTILLRRRILIQVSRILRPPMPNGTTDRQMPLKAQRTPPAAKMMKSKTGNPDKRRSVEPNSVIEILDVLPYGVYQAFRLVPRLPFLPTIV